MKFTQSLLLLLLLLGGCRSYTFSGETRASNLSDQGVNQVKLMCGDAELHFGWLSPQFDKKKASFKSILGGFSSSGAPSELYIVWHEGVFKKTASIPANIFIEHAEHASSISIHYLGDDSWKTFFHSGKFSNSPVISELTIRDSVAIPLIIGHWELKDALVPLPQSMRKDITSQVLSFLSDGKCIEVSNLRSKPASISGNYLLTPDSVEVTSRDGKLLWKGELLFRPCEYMQVMKEDRVVFGYQRIPSASEATGSDIRIRRPMQSDHPAFNENECVKLF